MVVFGKLIETEALVVVGTLVDIVDEEMDVEVDVDVELVCLVVVEDRVLTELVVEGIFSELVDIVD